MERDQKAGWNRIWLFGPYSNITKLFGRPERQIDYLQHEIAAACPRNYPHHRSSSDRPRRTSDYYLCAARARAALYDTNSIYKFGKLRIPSITYSNIDCTVYQFYEFEWDGL